MTQVMAVDIAALRLALLPGVGPQLRRALRDHFGTAGAVLQAAPEQLRRVPRIGSQLGRRIYEAARALDVTELVANCQQHEIQILLEEDPRYPALLREIADPPGVLFCGGQLQEADRLSVAIVGTRQATAYGLRQAERIASELARGGITVVSGLARGIDAAAHRGALRAGGRTVAVVAGGLLKLYPPEHAELARRIGKQGALLTEAPPNMPPSSNCFPRRNRIITGISLGVVVIEAGLRSGALISARHALEQGREVFALPGPVDSEVSQGCHLLLRDGAKLVARVEDILEELGPLASAALGDATSGGVQSTSSAAADKRSEERPPENLSPVELAVWRAVARQPTAIDVVIRGSGLAAPQVLSAISRLESRRLLERLSGAFVKRM